MVLSISFHYNEYANETTRQSSLPQADTESCLCAAETTAGVSSGFRLTNPAAPNPMRNPADKTTKNLFVSWALSSDARSAALSALSRVAAIFSSHPRSPHPCLCRHTNPLPRWRHTSKYYAEVLADSVFARVRKRVLPGTDRLHLARAAHRLASADLLQRNNAGC